MKNNIILLNLLAVVFFTSVSGFAHPQLERLSVARSSYHGKSEGVMELIKDQKVGSMYLMAKPGPNGLEIAPLPFDVPSDVHWDELSPVIKDFLQCLLDEVVSNKLHVVPYALVRVVKYSGYNSELSSGWHVDGPAYKASTYEESIAFPMPRTFISFSNSKDDLNTRFSTLAPPVAYEDYQTIGDYLVQGIEEGDFSSGDMSLIYHRAPTKEELGSSERLLIVFEGQGSPSE